MTQNDQANNSKQPNQQPICLFVFVLIAHRKRKLHYCKKWKEAINKQSEKGETRTAKTSATVEWLNNDKNNNKNDKGGKNILPLPKENKKNK